MKKLFLLLLLFPGLGVLYGQKKLNLKIPKRTDVISFNLSQLADAGLPNTRAIGLDYEKGISRKKAIIVGLAYVTGDRSFNNLGLNEIMNVQGLKAGLGYRKYIKRNGLLKWYFGPKVNHTAAIYQSGLSDNSIRHHRTDITMNVGQQVKIGRLDLEIFIGLGAKVVHNNNTAFVDEVPFNTYATQKAWSDIWSTESGVKTGLTIPFGIKLGWWF